MSIRASFRTDVSSGPYRRLTVVSAEEPNGTELQLAFDDNPGARADQEALFQQRQSAAMFFADDVQRAHDRMATRGAKFTMPPTKATGSTIAMLDDTCGNLIQSTARDTSAS